MNKPIASNAILILIAFSILFPGYSIAQKLTREVREKFATMVMELDGSLKTKFQTAIDNNTPIVELTPTEFRAFRANPANPFDINDVDPDDLDGNIELRFELPSLRNRPVRPYERQSRSLRRNLRSSIAGAYRSTVEVTNGTDQIALGTVVDTNGLIITKASELDGQNNLYCKLSDRRLLKAELVKTSQSNDIALLRVNATGLNPVSWSDSQPLNGTFVVTPNQEGEVVAVGTYSVVARSTMGENEGFLGVAPRTVSTGVEIVEQIDADTAAFAAGLQQGDVITAIDDARVFEAYQLTNEIRKRRAGDQIRIQFIRSGQDKTTTAKLASRIMSGERAARFKMMSRLGAIPSERDSGFPVVFQHDSPLFPEQCGGPICDLRGNVLGINIARETRASTFAIPASHLKTIVDELIRYELAARSGNPR